MPSPLALVERMVRPRATSLRQNKVWMDHNCWYCVVNPSSMAFVQSVSSISAGPRGLRRWLSGEGGPKIVPGPVMPILAALMAEIRAR